MWLAGKKFILYCDCTYGCSKTPRYNFQGGSNWVHVIELAEADIISHTDLR